jgi:hypothetical protein
VYLQKQKEQRAARFKRHKEFVIESDGRKTGNPGIKHTFMQAFKDFNEKHVKPLYLGKMDQACEFCGAYYFKCELPAGPKQYSKCCDFDRMVNTTVNLDQNGKLATIAERTF